MDVTEPIAFGDEEWKKLRAACRARTRLEVDDRAKADLEIILRAGVQHGANVVSFGAEGDALIPCQVGATAGLQRETVFSADGLRVDVSTADQGMNPRSQAAAAGLTPTDAGTGGVKHELGTSTINVTAPGGDNVAFEAKPIIEIVGKVGVQAAQIGGKGRGLEVNILVADAEIPTVEIVVLVAGLGRRGSVRESGRGNEQRVDGRGGKRGNKIEIVCGRRGRLS